MNLYNSTPLPPHRAAARFIELDSNLATADHAIIVISGQVKVYHLDDAIEYEALSYVWGTTTSTLNIRLNGQDFAVGLNLHAALRQLSLNRSEDNTLHKRLWIDAICIDQSNHDEKNSQVMQMTRIYACASRVILWLGVPDEHIALAFDTLQLFARDDGTTDGSATCVELEKEHGERTKAIHGLSQRQYFERVWIIQEAVAAKAALIVCGSLTMDYRDFIRAFSRVTGSGYYPHSSTTHITSMGMWRERYLLEPSQEREDALDLQALLMHSRDKACKDNRDRIYGIRGICAQRFAEGIEVNYGDTVEAVYINCAKHWFTTRSDLRVLSTIEPRHSSTTMLTLPSWVPDWSQSNHPSGVMQRYFRFLPEKRFRAAGETLACAEFSGMPETLTLKGFRFDDIAEIIDIKFALGIQHGLHEPLSQASFSGFVAELRSQTTYAYAGESFHNVVLRTITGDRTGLSSRVADEYRFKYLTAYSTWRLSHDRSVFELPDEAWKEVTEAISQILADKNMLITTRGYIGICRSGFEIGDLACIFFGGEVPFIIRSVDEVQNTFRLLSECYIHGIMDGEASPGTENEELFRLV